MAHYFCVPASDELDANALEFLSLIQQQSDQIPESLLVAISDKVMEDILSALVLRLLDMMNDNRITVSIARQFMSATRATASLMNRQLAGRIPRQDLDRLADYLRSRRLVEYAPDDTLRHMALPLSVSLHGELLFAHDVAQRGEAKQNQERITASLLDFLDVIHHTIVGAPLELVRLGLISRKAADLASSALRKGGQAFVRNVVPKLGEREMQHIATYYHPFIRHLPTLEAGPLGLELQHPPAQRAG